MDTSTLPTKNNLIRLQGKIKLSKQGQELLEKKKFILTIEKNKYQNKKQDLENQIQELFKDAYLKLEKAIIDIGIDDLTEISEHIEYDDSVNIKYKSIMGVEIPSVISDKEDMKLEYGLYNTTISVDEAILAFNNVKYKLIELAEIENIILRLDQSIDKVQKRSNALKDIIIPKDEKIEAEIKGILEEREREEFSRLKVVKGNKSETKINHNIAINQKNVRKKY